MTTSLAATTGEIKGRGYHRITGACAVAVGLALAAAAAGCADMLAGLLGGSNDGTAFSGTTNLVCDVTYYDNDFDYGFDLPDGAELNRSDNDQDALTNSLWTLTLDGAFLNIRTSVRDHAGGQSLAEVVQNADNEAVLAGADLSMEQSVSLADGDEGFESVLEYDGLTTFRVQTVEHERLYIVEAIVATDARTDDIDAVIQNTVLSLCAD